MLLPFRQRLLYLVPMARTTTTRWLTSRTLEDRRSGNPKNLRLRPSALDIAYIHLDNREPGIESNITYCCGRRLSKMTASITQRPMVFLPSACRCRLLAIVCCV